MTEDYNSIKRRLEEKIEEHLVEKDEGHTTKYSRMRKIIIFGNEVNIVNPFRKSYTLLRYMRKPKLKERLSWMFKDKLYTRENEYKDIPECKKEIRNYKKEDLEEIIIYKLNKLETSGLNLKRKKEDKMGKIDYLRDLDMNPKQIQYKWAYDSSFQEIKDTYEILSNKKILRKKDISKKEIKKYTETFKTRVNRILKLGVKYAITPDNILLMDNLLNYTKKNKLVPKKIKIKNNLEKKIY